MGFSVSGSAAIVFAGMFIAFGTFYGAVSNGFEQVNDAQQDRTDRVLAEQNTAIEIQSAVLDNDQDELRVNATNNGTVSLALNRTDVLVDGTYRTDWQAGATVGGNGESYLWLPGERLSLNVSEASADRVKLVTENGVAATAEVTTT